MASMGVESTFWAFTIRKENNRQQVEKTVFTVSIFANEGTPCHALIHAVT
jgi:hypothetical protein